MKKLTVLFAAFCAVLSVSCTQEGKKYVVKGTAPEEGAVVYLVDQTTTEPVDSAVVTDGAFAFKGRAAENAFMGVRYADRKVSRWVSSFFNDGTPVTVNFADSTVAGSDLNSRLSQYRLDLAKCEAELTRLSREFGRLPEEERAAKREEYSAAYKKMTDAYKSAIEDNMDNLIPVAFVGAMADVLGKEKYDEILASGSAIATHPYVVEFQRKQEEAAAKRKEIEEKKKAVVGQRFLDLQEPDPDGNMHSLSEYAGKGKWVLVDFWASWCGPCKREMPNVVAAYKKYHAKGFEIVGLSFDRDKEAWVKAIAEWKMPWIHLSDLKYWDTVAHEVYTVNAIPDNILIDPEGTVVARDLRGSDLEAKLAEVFKK